MLVPLCICSLIAPLPIRTKVICVLHPIEQRKPTNTGHLLEMMLEGAECRVRGERGETLDAHDFNEPSRRTLLLFPSDDARELSPELLAEDPRPIRLIVPDATWKQASRISRKVEELREAERVVLSPGQVSQYQLRRSIKPGALCTYEAVTEALCVIEGQEVRAPLEELFRIFVDRTLWSRGDLKVNEVTGGITDAVTQWKHSGALSMITFPCPGEKPCGPCGVRSRGRFLGRSPSDCIRR